MHELVLRLSEALVDPVSDALVDELDALAVTVADAEAGTDAEAPLFGEPGLAPAPAGWRCSELTALFADEPAATAATAALLARRDFAGAVQPAALRPVADADWVRLTQSQFEPIPITRDFWVVASWHQPPPQAKTLIRIDPGPAFGTGAHPTTRMCLRWIASALGGDPAAARRARVLDYGCGSGILAIAAALHGAAAVDAVDLDPAAVDAARANAQAHRVAVRAGAPESAGDDYTLVLANILARPLELLAPLLAGKLAPQGQLVLAGILDRQAGELAAAYAPWLDLEVVDRDDGWVLMTGRRRG